MHEAEDPAEPIAPTEEVATDMVGDVPAGLDDFAGLDDYAALDDDDLGPGEGPRLHTALPPRLESWRRRSATGAILTGIGLGLKAALTPEHEETAIVMQASGEPPTDLSVEAELGGIIPAANVVRIRPWLLAQTANDKSFERRPPAGTTDPAAGTDAP
ncbi:MAG: hypothetical protein ACRDZ8_04900 [Acidimicrobiales bacterium]